MPSLNSLYDAGSISIQEARYRSLSDRLRKHTGLTDPVLFVSSPGRTELGGNHTDHNRGCVLCASVQHDMVAAVQPRSDNKIELHSDGFEDRFEIGLDFLERVSEEEGTTQALIRGVAGELAARGHKIGGFSAFVNSTVPVGSGLSSSASFEVLVGGIINELYNVGSISPVVLAQVGQRAENEYFGKPCGLMDQLACAVGGVLSIDFEDTANPVIHRIEVDFSGREFALVVVYTGGSHADLTDAYASIPKEMKAAAAVFDKEVLREVDETRLPDHLMQLRETVGDRATLRTLHFFAENRRVAQMQKALENDDFSAFLQLVRASGFSSLGVLQNIIPPASDGREQPMALALGASNLFFERTGRGGSRISGGGFAGTIQTYVHREDFAEYVKLMESLFGKDCVQRLTIRPFGVAPVEQK
ncbi:MAG: galactokinase family protein [bacterium]